MSEGRRKSSFFALYGIERGELLTTRDCGAKWHGLPLDRPIQIVSVSDERYLVILIHWARCPCRILDRIVWLRLLCSLLS